MALKGPSLTHRLLSAGASQNPQIVKAGPGKLHSIKLFAAAAVFLKIYDTAVTPTSAMTPRHTLRLVAAVNNSFDWSDGVLFGQGIGYRITGLAADADTTNVVAADVLTMNIDYQ